MARRLSQAEYDMWKKQVWSKLSDSEKIDRMVMLCAGHRYFGQSRPPFDREVFEILQSMYAVDFVMDTLYDMDGFWSIMQDRACHKKNWRKTLFNRLRTQSRYLKAAALRKEQKRPAGDLCPGCRRVFGVEVSDKRYGRYCIECHLRGGGQR